MTKEFRHPRDLQMHGASITLCRDSTSAVFTISSSGASACGILTVGIALSIGRVRLVG